MGTHSLIIMRTKGSDGTYTIWSVLYQQYDGYFEGVGKNLLMFLEDIKIVNGISFGVTQGIANGAGCLFAQIVSHFKKEVGGTYLCPPNEEQLEEFNYYVDIDEDTKDINIKIKYCNDLGFSGSIPEALSFIEK